MYLVSIDVETTGLDPERHWATEIAWVDEAGASGTLIPYHSLEGASREALAMQGYAERLGCEPYASGGEIRALHQRLSGARLLGANVRFDAAFLSKTFAHYHLRPTDPWHYRLLDVEAYGAGVLALRWGDVPTLHSLAVLLREEWDEKQAHGALYDATKALAIYRKLHEIAQTRAALEEAERAFERNLLASIGGAH